MEMKSKMKVVIPKERLVPADGRKHVEDPSAGAAGGGKSPLPPKPPTTATPDDDGEYSDAEDIVELWDINELYAHPLQAVHFDHKSDADFEEFVEDFRINGQKVPLGILPDGAIIDGLRRYSAGIAVGIKQMKVVVKHKLAKAGDAAIELYLITANTSRRQLTKLQQARLFLRTRELMEQTGERTPRGKQRDDWAARFGMSGRNLERYVELLKHPRELQNAVEDKKLSLVKALALMKLAPEKYEPILAMLREGRNVRLAVNAILPDKPKVELTDKKFARQLRDWLLDAEQLSQDMERLKTAIKSRHVERLQTAQALAGSLLQVLGADSDDEPAADDQSPEEDSEELAAEDEDAESDEEGEEEESTED